MIVTECPECGHAVSGHHHRGCRPGCDCSMKPDELVTPSSAREAVRHFLGGFLPLLSAPSDELPQVTRWEGVGLLARWAAILGALAYGLTLHGVPLVGPIAAGVGYLLLALLTLASAVGWIEARRPPGEPYEPPGWFYAVGFLVAAGVWLGASAWLAGGCL